MTWEKACRIADISLPALPYPAEIEPYNSASLTQVIPRKKIKVQPPLPCASYTTSIFDNCSSLRALERTRLRHTNSRLYSYHP